MNFLAGLFIAASVALACLKLAGVITASWLVVFLPVIAAALMIILGLILAVTVYKATKKRIKKSPLWDEFR